MLLVWIAIMMLVPMEIVNIVWCWQVRSSRGIASGFGRMTMAHPRSSNNRGRSVAMCCCISVKTMRVLLDIMYWIAMPGWSNGRRRKSILCRMGIVIYRITICTKIISGLIFVEGRSARWKVATIKYRWGIGIIPTGVVWMRNISRNRRDPRIYRLVAATMVLTHRVRMTSNKVIVVAHASTSGVFSRSNFLDRVGHTGTSTWWGICFRKGCRCGVRRRPHDLIIIVRPSLSGSTLVRFPMVFAIVAIAVVPRRRSIKGNFRCVLLLLVAIVGTLGRDKLAELIIPGVHIGWKFPLVLG